MKILILKPRSCTSAVAAKVERIENLAVQLGHRIIEQTFDGSLYSRVVDEKPKVVFNLASTYEWNKTGYIPAILEIAGVHYTGSGFLTLSLARTYTKLSPMLENSGIPVPPYRIMRVDDGIAVKALRFPAEIHRDGEQKSISVSNQAELKDALRSLPPQEEVEICENLKKAAIKAYILDSHILPLSLDPKIQELALAAYNLIEARGLTRFDFIQGESLWLKGIDAAPDPLDKAFLKAAASAGLDETAIIRTMIAQASSD